MKTKSEKVLHKISGTVHAQFVTCGKQNCKCVQGELHGAYYYHFVRVDGKLTKRYLKASEVEETRQACIRRRQHEQTERARADATWNQFREIRESLRESQNLYT